MGVTSDFQLLSLFIVEAAATIFSRSYAPDTKLDHVHTVLLTQQERNIPIVQLQILRWTLLSSDRILPEPPVVISWLPDLVKQSLVVQLYYFSLLQT